LGAMTRVGIKNIRTRLQSKLAEAMTAEEVDALLREAEGDARFLSQNMDRRLDETVAEHDDAGGVVAGTESDAEIKARNLRTAINKDIEVISGKAVAFADERKAALV